MQGLFHEFEKKSKDFLEDSKKEQMGAKSGKVGQESRDRQKIAFKQDRNICRCEKQPGLLNSMGVYAVDITNGGLKWEFAPKNLFSSSPCIIGEVLYTGSVDGYVYALRLEDGQKLWEYKIGYVISSISTIGPVIAVISGSSNPGTQDLYLLREENGGR